MSKLRIRIELDLYDELDVTIRDVDESVTDKLITDVLHTLEMAKSTQTTPIKDKL